MIIDEFFDRRSKMRLIGRDDNVLAIEEYNVSLASRHKHNPPHPYNDRISIDQIGMYRK
jgi:hypothetical protein